jgi:hypothetical protein
MKVEVIPADLMETNPRNPNNHLTPEERYARFIQILAEVYKEVMRGESGSDVPTGSPI